jgi:hypothetical protein
MGTVTTFVHPASYVRVIGDGRLVHAASLRLFREHLVKRAEMPRCHTPLIPHCVRTRLSDARLTEAAITCGVCAPGAAQIPNLDVTATVLREQLAASATYDVIGGAYVAIIGGESEGVEPDEDDGDGNPRVRPVSEREAERLWATALDALLDRLLAPRYPADVLFDALEASR